jgi:hypothetical protein
MAIGERERNMIENEREKENEILFYFSCLLFLVYIPSMINISKIHFFLGSLRN